jgi:hypothetical protein
VHRVVELPQSSFKGKKRLLGDSMVETLEGESGRDSLPSSPYVEPDEDDDDFKSTVGSDDEDERQENEGVGGIDSSPMLDDSIMSHNATLAAGTPSTWAFKSVFGMSKTVTSTIKKAGLSAASSPGQDSRRLSASFLNSGIKGGTPLTLHGACTCLLCRQWAYSCGQSMCAVLFAASSVPDTGCAVCGRSDTRQLFALCVLPGRVTEQCCESVGAECFCTLGHGQQKPKGAAVPPDV